MNNTKFKEFIDPIITGMIKDLGGVEAVRKLHEQIPMQMFIAGAVFGCASMRLGRFPWREGATDLCEVILNQEEIRRTLDLVRLRLETESTSV